LLVFIVINIAIRASGVGYIGYGFLFYNGAAVLSLAFAAIFAAIAKRNYGNCSCYGQRHNKAFCCNYKFIFCVFLQKQIKVWKAFK